MGRWIAAILVTGAIAAGGWYYWTRLREAGPGTVSAPAPSGKQAYKYEDEHGVLHFVSSINEIPPEYRDQVDAVELGKLETYKSPARQGKEGEGESEAK